MSIGITIFCNTDRVSEITDALAIADMHFKIFRIIHESDSIVEIYDAPADSLTWLNLKFGDVIVRSFVF